MTEELKNLTNNLAFKLDATRLLIRTWTGDFMTTDDSWIAFKNVCKYYLRDEILKEEKERNA